MLSVLLVTACADNELAPSGDLKAEVSVSLMPEVEPMVIDVASTRAQSWVGPPKTALFDNSTYPYVKSMIAWGYDWNDTPLFTPRTEVTRDAKGGSGWPILDSEGKGVAWPPSNIGNLHFYAVTNALQTGESSLYSGNIQVMQDPTYERGPTIILHNRWWTTNVERMVGESMVNAENYTNTAYLGGESQPVTIKFRHVYACIRLIHANSENGQTAYNRGVTDNYLNASDFGAISTSCWVNNKFRAGRYGHPEEDTWLPFSGTEMVLGDFRSLWMGSSNCYFLVPHKFPKPKKFNGYRLSATARNEFRDQGLGITSSDNVPVGKRMYGTLPGTEWKAGHYYEYAISYQPHGVLLYNQEEQWGDSAPTASDISDIGNTPVFTQEDYAPKSTFDSERRFSFVLWCYQQKNGVSSTLLNQEWYFNQKYHDTGDPWPDQETERHPVQFWAYSNDAILLKDTLLICGGTNNNITYPNRFSGSGSYDNPPTVTIDNEKYTFFYGVPDEQNYVSGLGECQDVTLKFRHGMAELMFKPGSRNSKTLKNVKINLCKQGVFSIKEQQWTEYIDTKEKAFTPNDTEWYDVIPQTFSELPVTLEYTDNSSETIKLKDIRWEPGHRYVYTLK